MEKQHDLLYNYLLSVYSKEYSERIIKGIKNPAKYPWITKELTLIYQNFKNNEKIFMDKNFLKIFQIIEDELAYALLIYQDSKCKPLNFINYKK